MATYEAKRYDFSGANITALNGSNVASGTVASARLADLATSKITSGTFADARISSGSVTQHVSAVTNTAGTWTPSFNSIGTDNVNGRYVKVGRVVTAVVDFRRTSNTNNDNLFYISGLPSTSWNSGGIVGGGAVTGHHSYGSSYSMKAIVFKNQDRIYFRNSEADGAFDDAGGDAMIRNSDMGSTAYYIVTVTYIAAS